MRVSNQNSIARKCVQLVAMITSLAPFHCAELRNNLRTITQLNTLGKLWYRKYKYNVVTQQQIFISNLLNHLLNSVQWVCLSLHALETLELFTHKKHKKWLGYGLQRRIQGGLLGLSPPPWTSEIYWFQGIFMPQWVLSPPLERKKFKPRQIPEYAPDGLLYFILLRKTISDSCRINNLTIEKGAKNSPLLLTNLTFSLESVSESWIFLISISSPDSETSRIWLKGTVSVI